MNQKPFPDAQEFKLDPWSRRPPTGVPTSPTINTITPNFSRTPGGGSATIAGTNFAQGSDGTNPTVTIGGVAATVTAVTSTQITITVPVGASSGYQDVVVTNPNGQAATLQGGFLYYAGTLTAVSPSYANVAGGVQVTVKGVSLVSGCTFTFGGTPATGVVQIDDTQYVMTVPTHVFGYVDVVMTEPGGAQSTLRNGFQYTLLNRGSDIRRMQPGAIMIQQQLGSTPDSATFSIDGQSRKPVPGEEISIVDSVTTDTLFDGIIMSADQTYEGMTDQLVWNCTASDFTYILNKLRPFGSYSLVSASLVVTDLMQKYAPSFDLAFVQTNLALVTLSFDGTKTMSEALDMIAQAIGGGRWHLVGRALHFFNPPVTTKIIVPAGSTGTGADFTAATLSLGGSTGSLTPYDVAYYAVRVTFLYSNGTESRLGPTSNVIASDGYHYLTLTNLPIGLDPGGGITCVGRKVYYLEGANAIASGIQINDNSTVTVSFAPTVAIPPTVGTNIVGSVVTAADAGTAGAVQQTVSLGAGGDTFTASNFYSSLGMFFEFGGTPKTDFVTNFADFRGGFLLTLQPDMIDASSRQYATWVQFAVSFVYPDGSESTISNWWGSNNTTGLPIYGQTASFMANITYLSPGQLPQYTCFYSSHLPVAPTVNNQQPVSVNLFIRVVGHRLALAGAGGGGGSADDQMIANPIAQFIGNVPYFDGSNASGPTLGGNQLSGTTVVPAAPANLGTQPQQVPNTTTPTYVWPNPDGPYLEDYSNPHDIDDNDEDLLHEDSGSQAFTSTEDITQLRNRVKVFGASTVTVADANVGDVSVAIANDAIFPPNGASVLAANGVGLSFFGVSSAFAATNTPARLLLTAPLAAAIPNGTEIDFYCLAEDTDAQRQRGLIELDALGNPTDGIHEYVVRDTSLDTTEAVYLRANAELALFKDPIITIKYATRDPLTRVGARVNVNLSNPPCQGTFLIQSVQIDQIRDEGDQVAPRYTVTASTVFYDLTNFFLLLTNGSAVGGSGSTQNATGASSQVGVVSAAAQLAVGSGTTTIDASTFRGSFCYSFFGASNATSFTTIGVSGTSISAGTSGSSTAFPDTRGQWIRVTCGGVGNATALTNSSMDFYARMNPKFRGYFRISSDISGQRTWIGWKQSAAPLFPDTDTTTGGGPGFGVRFMNVVGGAQDAGWQLWTTDNVTFTLGPSITTAPPTVGTEYDFTIEVSGGNTGLPVFTVTVNGESAAMSIPIGIINQVMSFAHFQYWHSGPVKGIDYLRVYLQHGLLL